VTTASTSPLGQALAQAISSLRSHLKDPLAPITVIVPAGPNGNLARRALATQGPILRVWFETPDGLLRDQLPASSWSTLRPEPPGWYRVTVARVVEELARASQLGRFGQRLTRRAWRDPLVAALSRLERSGVNAVDLEAVAATAAATAAGHIAERAALIAAILQKVDRARTEAGFAAPFDVARRATDAVEKEPGVGAALAAGVVVLGDRELSFATFTFLRAWLAPRAAAGALVRVLCPPASHLAPAPWGIALACGEVPTNTVELGSLSPRLRGLSQRLYAQQLPMQGQLPPPPSTAAPVDESVTFARTPDDVRECVEAVRVVQEAIEAGTPLDRIAILLPDSAPRGALEEALDRAGIPCTWLMGFPAQELTAARLLRLAVDVENGDDGVLRVYELLTHPALDLRARLGPDAVRGRGRWRRMLGEVKRGRGLDKIAKAVEGRPGREGLEGEDLEREQRARTSLVTCLRALHEALAPFGAEGDLGDRTTGDRTLGDRAPGDRTLGDRTLGDRTVGDRTVGDRAPGAPGDRTLGGHARAWRRFLLDFARASESRGKLLALLDPIASSRSGFALTAAQAREELESLLEREVSRGNLAECSIRVLPPMYLLGGEVDVVVMLGLTEGRFPKAAREDPVLPDELFTALSTHLGRPFPLARDREDLERRRFAAAVGAARRRVWLSIPRLEFATERPTLPSTLALEAMSAVLGRRARFADLNDDALIVRAGSRARGWPRDVATAVGSLEHLVARLASDAADAVSAAVTALASQATPRGLLQLHRSMTRARTGDIDAFTGAVPPAVLAAPGLDGAPVDLTQVVALFKDPGAYFFRHMLGAFPPPSLEARGAPLERPTLEELLLNAARSERVPSGDVEQALTRAVLAKLDEQRAAGAFDDASLETAKPMLQAVARDLAQKIERFARAYDPEGPVAIAEDVPWRIQGLKGRVVPLEEGCTLVDVSRRRPHAKLQVGDRPDLTLSAVALDRDDTTIDHIAVLALEDGEGSAAVEKLKDETLQQLRAVTEAAKAGRFALHDTEKLRLSGDMKKEVVDDVEAAPEEEGA
jgi:hypothetical protein